MLLPTDGVELPAVAEADPFVDLAGDFDPVFAEAMASLTEAVLPASTEISAETVCPLLSTYAV